MSLESIFTIIQQALAIIFSIGVLYVLRIWVARSLEQEEQRKVNLEIARQVRLSAFQRSVKILQTDRFVEGRRLSESIRLEEQDGIEQRH